MGSTLSSNNAIYAPGTYYGKWIPRKGEAIYKIIDYPRLDDQEKVDRNQPYGCSIILVGKHEGYKLGFATTEEREKFKENFLKEWEEWEDNTLSDNNIKSNKRD